MSPLRTVVYEKEENVANYFSGENTWGFDCVCVKRDCGELFSYYLENEADVMVVCDKGMDRERLEYVLEIVYDNYCKHILIVTDTPYDNESYLYLDGGTSNFDLRLSLMLLKIKQQIAASAQNRLNVLTDKVESVLTALMFSSRHDGYHYYKDAIVQAYMHFPYSYPTMKLYEDIGNKYGKSAHAVEKSMRGALTSAIERLHQLPITPENYRIRAQLSANTTNNMTISMVVSWLRSNRELELDEAHLK